MFRTKKDVDKHVQDINSKIKNASERSLKGYAIAKLYYGVGDFEAARRHLGAYLTEKDTSAVAHKLSGDILEKLQQPEKALAAYKKAQELDSSPELVSRICGLMATLPVEPGRAKYWVEVGEKSAPHSDSVYRLREAMLAATEGENGPALEEVLLAEVKAKPRDVGLRIRLASLYQRVGRTETGWAMVAELEAGLPWPHSREWYAALVEMAENYQVQFKSKCHPPPGFAATPSPPLLRGANPFAAMGPVPLRRHGPSMADILLAFDRHGEGYLTMPKVSVDMARHEGGMSPSEQLEFWAEADPANTGRLTYMPWIRRTRPPAPSSP